MNEELFKEYIDRVDRAIKALQDLWSDDMLPETQIRLGGKIEGVKLARSYAIEMFYNERLVKYSTVITPGVLETPEKKPKK